jgi:hypothetical protein
LKTLPLKEQQNSASFMTTTELNSLKWCITWTLLSYMSSRYVKNLLKIRSKFLLSVPIYKAFWPNTSNDLLPAQQYSDRYITISLFNLSIVLYFSLLYKRVSDVNWTQLVWCSVELTSVPRMVVTLRLQFVIVITIK